MKKAAFFLLVSGLVIYVIYLIAVPHYQYYAFKSDVSELMKVSRGFPKEVLGNVMKIVEEYEIPVGEKDVQVTQENDKFVVRTSWSVTVDFFTIHQETFNFSVDTSKPD